MSRVSRFVYRQIVTGILILSSLCAARVASAAPITLEVSPSTVTVLPGESFSLNLEVSGAVDLFDYQFDLLFDPAFLLATDVSDGGFLTSDGGTSLFGGPLALIDNPAGVITVLDSLTGPAPPATGVSGAGALLVFKFTALGVGVSTIDLANLILEDSAGTPIAAQIIGGRVQIGVSDPTPVPEPASITLVVTGAAGGWWRRRRNLRAATSPPCRARR